MHIIYYAIHRADRASSLDSNKENICILFYYLKVVLFTYCQFLLWITIDFCCDRP